MSNSAAYVDNDRASAPAASSKMFDVGASVLPPTENGCTLWVGSAGDLCVDLMRDPDGHKTVFKNVPVGEFNYRVKKVYGVSDGTTAADIVMAW